MCAICALSCWGSLSAPTSRDQRQRRAPTLHYSTLQSSSTDAERTPLKSGLWQARQSVSPLRRKLF